MQRVPHFGKLFRADERNDDDYCVTTIEQVLQQLNKK
jgi:hypothetical protein